mmetsp:Transcript_17696/g.20508  ORF Transcript_17696/g.20508 Transcript_17696/m.20508 type:complete len:354 (+) Transcript_17696:84-1145(+)
MASDSVCQFTDLSPGGNNCSDRGVCISNLCVCEPDWFGVGDFATESQDCDVHTVSIRALWGITLVPFVLSLFLCLYYVFFGLVVLRRRISSALWAAIFNAVSSVCLIVVAIKKITEDHIPAIGKDTVVTAFFSVGTALVFWSAYFLMRQVTVAYMRITERLGINVSSLYQKLPLVASGLSTVPMFIPVFCLFDPNRCHIYGVLHYMLTLPSLVALYIFNRYCLYNLLKSVRQTIDANASNQFLQMSTNSSASRNFEVLLRKLKPFNKILTICCVGSFVVVVLVTWPFFLRKSSYLLPLLWHTGGWSVVTGVHLVCNGEQSVNNQKVSKAVTAMVGKTKERSETTSVKPSEADL